MKSSKIIIFNYDFYPSNLVSSHRVTFWARNLNKHLKQNSKLSIITCNKNAQSVEGVDNLSILKTTNNKLTNVFNLIKELRKTKEKSTFIISAGPFYFLLAIFFLPWNMKVIIDLRDPFADDPKHHTRAIKRFLKRIFQRLFIAKCDAVITINEKLLKHFKVKNKKSLIIPNGFDSNQFETQETKSSPNIKNNAIILGKVYQNINPIIKSIQSNTPEFKVTQYINKSCTEDINILNEDFGITILPQIKKINIKEECSKYDVGITSSYPEPYVLPVKLFDYIQAGLKIIVINDSNDGNSEIKNLLKNYPNKLFIYDGIIDKKEVDLFINSNFNFKQEEKFPERYFRNYSTRELASFIEENI